MPDLPLDDRVQPLAVGVWRMTEAQQVHGGADWRQRVAELVREQREEVVLLAAAALERSRRGPPLVNVLDNRDQRVGLSIVRGKGSEGDMRPHRVATR